MSKRLAERSTGTQLVTENKSNKNEIHLTCMELVIKHICIKPYTSALLVKEIKLYGSARVNRCLKQLTDAGLIGRVWENDRKINFVYYNLRL